MDPAAATTTVSSAGRTLALAALLIAGGNILSSVLGQARNSVISFYWGTSPASAAYTIASAVPNTLYDLLIGGLVSAALVPIFSELADRDNDGLGEVAGTIFASLALVIIAASGMIWLFAPALSGLITSAKTQDPALRPLVASLIRWMSPALLFMALTGLLTGLSQARHRFLLPSLALGFFNAGMIGAAIVLHRRFDIRSLAVGMVIGAGCQVTLLLPALRGIPLRWGQGWRRPEVRRILRLYAPVLVGIGFSVVGTIVDRRLASGVPQRGAAAVMQFATTLIQFGMGVITSAIALAALPTLSRQGFDPAQQVEYRRTLGMSLQAVLLFILPAAVGLAMLAGPIVVVLFRHGAFAADPDSTRLTTNALLVYVPSMVAAAIDQPLIFAFYARKNTLAPNLVQGVAIGAYLLVALGTVHAFGMYGLILGNVVQWGVHALVMIGLAQRYLGGLQGQGLGRAVAKGLVACAGMAAAIEGMLWFSNGLRVPGLAYWQLIGGIVLGIGVYGALAAAIRIPLFELCVAGLRGRVRHRGPAPQS
ncbi:MAG: murein biosynthesis integral membrane protein MurJ [Herpetosiphon sp.]